MKRFKKHLGMMAGALTGAAAGFFYWYAIGCEGSCAIQSSPLLSTLYGLLLGGSAGDFVHQLIQKYFSSYIS